jgi:hypothetical protein
MSNKMEFPTKIEKAIRTPKTFQFSHYIQRAFEITNARRTAFMGATFTYVIIGLVVMMMLAVVFAGYFSLAMQSAIENEENVVNPASGILTQIMGVIAAAFFIAPIPAGFAQAANTIERNEFLSFDHFFAGFRLPQWWNIALTYAMIALIGALITYPFSSAIDPMSLELLGTNPAEYFSSVLGTAMLGSILMWILRSVYRWAEMASYFFELKGWQAMEASRQLMGVNFLWFMLFDLVFIIGVILTIFSMALLVSLLGILGSLIGVLAFFFLACYLMPLYLNFHYAAFSDRVNLVETDEDTTQVDSIIDHFMPE